MSRERKDARLVTMYKIAIENVVITKTGRHKPSFRQPRNVHYGNAYFI